MSVVRQLNRHLFRYNKSVINSPKRIELLSDPRIRLTTIWKMSSFQFSSVEELKVEHNPKERHFFIQLGNDMAVLQYRDVNPGVIDLIHTEVPKQLQGKGIAKILAQEAFDFVVRNKYKMIVSCTYLQNYLKDNPNPDYLKAVHKEVLNLN